MHTRISSLLLVFALASTARVVTAQSNPCAQTGCSVTFDWGNGGSAPDDDKVYGAPAGLESAFIRALNEAGWRTEAGTMMIMLRLTPQNRVSCEAMAGTNTDMSCHTVNRAVVSFTSSDTSVKAPGRVEVVPRCSDPKNWPTFAQFGQYAGQMVVYQVEKGGKGPRPSLKCLR